ncbi:winged helix-turn-helix domain-containing protein, partial [Burkholderia sp. Ac-20379]|uniref:winged helix-turn-helix domain-containing protein n=1 Tax=Burkholderia sp. Ac-20379 TaxID=2703900 RepID=UPI001980A3E4
MIRIGALHVDFERREVQRHGEALRVSARAFDILEVLFRANGATVTKDDILDAVWPNQVVEENRLQVHVAALRKAFDTDRELIRTVTGRGYLLVMHAATVREPAVRNELPASAGPMIGRDDDVAALLDRLGRASVVTLVGAGGIGKTSLALGVAQALRETQAAQVAFVELASADTRESVLATLALALGLAPEAVLLDPLQLLAALPAEGAVLMLDNAEHVIEAVARLVETLLGASGTLRILVTSREPLSIRSELVYRVEPLAVPPLDAGPEALAAYGAVALFLQRARGIAPGCAGDAPSLRLVADIC